MRIRTYLLLFAAVVLVPGFVLATIAVEQLLERERETALGTLRETVRSTALLIDGQVLRSIGGLTALGRSPHLASGDFAAFYEQAKAIDLPPDVWTLLLDETGTQRLNTVVPFGTPAPPPLARERVARALATGKPYLTGVLVGPVTGRKLTTLYMPAQSSPQGRLVVAQAFSVEHWKKTAMQGPIREGWLIGVLDRDGRFVSRSQRADELVGQEARPELVEAAANAKEGLIRHRTLEGTEVYDAFVHSDITGWTIAVAAPVETIEASARQAVAWLVGGLAAALTVALLAAAFLRRRLVHALEAAAVAARAIVSGGAAPAAPAPIAEINDLNDALADAGRSLGAERRARGEAESEREALLAGEMRAREAAQRDNIAKDQFIALLGHELRNPLAAVHGATAVLARGGATTETTARFLAIIERQNGHLRRIVDDLLDVSRLLSGKITLDPRPLDLAACVRGAVDAMRAGERHANRRFDVDLAPTWVVADAVRIEQVASNLIGNALKFSPEGSTVRVATGAAGDRAFLAVADRGDGVDSADLERIFKPFVQGVAASPHHAGGLGIGLALVRQLVALHGGTVEVSSGDGGLGSTFTVWLPLATTLAAAPPARPESLDTPDRPEAERRPMRATLHILLAEDNDDARDATAEMARAIGCTVDAFDSGDAAIAACTAAHAAGRPYDAAVVDIGMPGKSGLEVAAELRALPAGSGAVLIALTGYGGQADRKASAAAGFDAHLVKPVDLGELRTTLDWLVTARKRSGR